MASRTVTCTTCQRTFEQNQNVVRVDWGDPICFSCALAKITQGRAPEGDDFIAAARRSGEIDDEAWEEIRADDIAREYGGRFSAPLDDVGPDEYPVEPIWCTRCHEEERDCYCVVCGSCGEFEQECVCSDSLEAEEG